MQNLFLGISLGLFAAFLFNIGALIQKFSLNEMNEISLKKFQKSIKEMAGNKIWMLGFLMEFVGGIIHKIAINYGGITVVQPLLSVGFIFLALFSNKITKEKIDNQTIPSIIFLILTPFLISRSNIFPPSIEIIKFDVIVGCKNR
jgi:uncharacterized membrane protein